MSTFKLPSVTALNGSDVIQINTSDSVFGAVAGSFVQIANYQGVFLSSVNTTTQQIILTNPWQYADAVAVECTIAPISGVSALLTALQSTKGLLNKAYLLDAVQNQLKDVLLNGIEDRGSWQPSTNYFKNDIWRSADGKWYLVLLPYLSDAVDVAVDITSKYIAPYSKNVANGREIVAEEFGVYPDGSDNTAGFKKMLEYGELTGIRTISLSVGLYLNRNLQSDYAGWKFRGRAAARISGGGTRIGFIAESGDWFTMGSDDGLDHDLNNYDGPQGFELENVNIVNMSSNRTAPLNNRPTSSYHENSYVIRDWRGGGITLLGSVFIEGFEGFLDGVQSDINNLQNLIQAFCKKGIYLGPRSDQQILGRIYSYFCDTWLVIDRVNQVTINDAVQVACGSTIDNAIVITKGATSVVFNQPWFEGVSGIVDTRPYIGVGLVDGYNDTTDAADGIIVNNPLVSVVGAGSFGPNYLFEIGKATGVKLNGIAAPGGQSKSTNLVKYALFAAGFDHATSEFTYDGDKGNKNRIFDNLGTGNPKVQFKIASNGWSFGSHTGRHKIINTRADVPLGAGELTISQEGVAGGFALTADDYVGGQKTRFRSRRIIIDVFAYSFPAGDYEPEDYARYVGPDAFYGSGTTQRRLRGWYRKTFGDEHELWVDWWPDITFVHLGGDDIDGSTGFVLSNAAARMSLADSNTVLSGADYLQWGQEGVVGGLFFKAMTHPSGNLDILGLTRRIVHVNAMPTSDSWNQGDYAINTNIVLIGTGRHQYIVKGWSRKTTGSSHVLGVDWIVEKFFTRIFDPVSTRPSSGPYQAGDFVPSNLYIIYGSTGSKYRIDGWDRLTTGDQHLLNTDWAERRYYTGS